MSHQPLNINIPLPLYQILQTQAENSGITTEEAIVEAVKNYCDRPAQLSSLKQELITELKSYIHQLLAETNWRSTARPPAKQEKATEILPSVRPLKVGDLVQIRESDSPFYLQQATIISTSLIRATVDIGSAKHNFLKRDLRYISSNHA